MKRYVVQIKETLSRTVIIEAEDNYEAEETAEELLNEGEIYLECDDFTGRNVMALREATDDDVDIFKEVYKSK